MSTFGGHGCREFITGIVASGLVPREHLVYSFRVEVLSTHCLMALGALYPHLGGRNSSACSLSCCVTGLTCTSSSRFNGSILASTLRD